MRCWLGDPGNGAGVAVTVSPSVGRPIWARPRRGRMVSIPQGTIDRVVKLTLHVKPGGGDALHLMETFKLSNDKRFAEKLVDVVGLYLNSPDNAVALCMAEKA